MVPFSWSIVAEKINPPAEFSETPFACLLKASLKSSVISPSITISNASELLGLSQISLNCDCWSAAYNVPRISCASSSNSIKSSVSANTRSKLFLAGSDSIQTTGVPLSAKAIRFLSGFNSNSISMVCSGELTVPVILYAFLSKASSTSLSEEGISIRILSPGLNHNEKIESVSESKDISRLLISR